MSCSNEAKLSRKAAVDYNRNFEQSIQGKTAAIRVETGQTDLAASQTYLAILKWEVLFHTTHSPDIAHFDYDVFRSMAHGLSEPHLNSYKDVKK